jgi:hypothetical protein
MYTLKLHLFQVDPIVNALSGLLEEDWSASFSYKIAEILEVLEPHAYRQKRATDKLVIAHARRDEDNNVIRPKDEDGNIIEGQVEITDMNKFNEELSILLNEEISINVPVRISLEEFGDREIKGAVIQNLKPLLSQLQEVEKIEE